MAWPKGKARPEDAGRKKGTPNRKTQTLLDKCEEKGIDPFAALLELSQMAEREETRLGALKEICSYLYPKRKSLEHSGLTDPKVVNEIEKLSDLDAEELEKVIKEELKAKKG
jgi:hypothetical protein